MVFSNCNVVLGERYIAKCCLLVRVFFSVRKDRRRNCAKVAVETNVSCAMTGNKTQAEYWSSAPGLKWIKFEEDLDAAFEAVNKELIRRAKPTSGMKVLDVGCGTGATSRAFSQSLCPNGRLTALDISKPLLECAKSHADKVTIKPDYYLLDAQVDTIPGAPFDLVVSRFGVMFFSDPTAAFANIRKHLRPRGRLVVVAWSAMDENPWFKVPCHAAMSRLGPPDPAGPNAPGPLGFQDITYVIDMLEKAGFSDVVGEVSEVTLKYFGPLKKLADLASKIGPAARILKKHCGTDEDVKAIQETVLEKFRVFDEPDSICIPANLNFFEAVNPD